MLYVLELLQVEAYGAELWFIQPTFLRQAIRGRYLCPWSRRAFLTVMLMMLYSFTHTYTHTLTLTHTNNAAVACELSVSCEDAWGESIQSMWMLPSHASTKLLLTGWTFLNGMFNFLFSHWNLKLKYSVVLTFKWVLKINNLKYPVLIDNAKMCKMLSYLFKQSFRALNCKIPLQIQINV